MVFWLLSLLANRDKEEMSRTLLALSSSQDSCLAMRKSGCVPLLVQILHEDLPGGPDPEEPPPPGGPARGCSREARSRASAALHNIIYSQQDEGQARREMRVLQMLEQIRTYCDSGWDWMETRAGPMGGTGTGGEGHKVVGSQEECCIQVQSRSVVVLAVLCAEVPEPVEPQICQAVCAVMKLSFEEEYRRAMNELGGCHCCC